MEESGRADGGRSFFNKANGKGGIMWKGKGRSGMYALSSSNYCVRIEPLRENMGRVMLDTRCFISLLLASDWQTKEYQTVVIEMAPHRGAADAILIHDRHAP